MRLWRWTGIALAISIVATGSILWLYRPPDAVLRSSGGAIEGITNIHSRTESAMAGSFTFRETAQQAGISFHHFPFRRNSIIVEDMGSGLAWGDYDQDGDDDLFVVNFSMPFLENELPASSAAGHALYQNQGDGVFLDVSASSGIQYPSFGMAAAWGDYDNDGDLDLYVTNHGPNFLFRNNGDGTFSEIAAQAGVDDNRFGAGCMWGDYNRDGWIDLYVCNYVEFVFREADRRRQSRLQRVVYPYTLNPSSYAPQPNVCYRNNGDGTFTDVAQELNIHNVDGRSLSVTWTDFDLDGHPDLYIANDVSNNMMFRNTGNGRFTDISSSSLTADYRGAMGIAVGDYDRDSDFDMVITHWLAQENALYRNMCSFLASEPNLDLPLFFTDVAEEVGLGQISLDCVGWSTSFADFDNDGWLDIWISNGSTLERPDDPSCLLPQETFLFRREPGKEFVSVGKTSCARFGEPIVSRGGAFADYDRDGRLDFALQQHGSALLLFNNETQNNHRWIQLVLRQRHRNTYALGARVTVRTADGIQTQQVGSQGSYLSQNQLALHFGVGNSEIIDTIEIVWPDGCEETLTQIPSNQILAHVHIPDY